MARKRKNLGVNPPNVKLRRSPRLNKPEPEPPQMPPDNEPQPKQSEEQQEPAPPDSNSQPKQSERQPEPPQTREPAPPEGQPQPELSQAHYDFSRFLNSDSDEENFPFPETCFPGGSGPLQQIKYWSLFNSYPRDQRFRWNRCYLEEFTRDIKRCDDGGVLGNQWYLHFWLGQWIYHFGGGFQGELEPELTAAQKQRMLDQLDGYCIHKDWESLVDDLHPNIHPFLKQHIAQAFLSKTMHRRMIENPFFYFERPGRTTVDQVPTSWGMDLYNLWRELFDVDIPTAEHWRARTIKAFNSYKEKQAVDASVQLRYIKLRESAVNSVLSEVLDASSVLQPFLRVLSDPEKIQERRERLCKLLHKAADTAVWYWLGSLSLLFYPITKLEPFNEDLSKEDQIIEPPEPNYHAEGDTSMNGRAPALMLSPPVTRLDPFEQRHGIMESLLAPAQVIVSKAREGMPEPSERRHQLVHQSQQDVFLYMMMRRDQILQGRNNLDEGERPAS